VSPAPRKVKEAIYVPAVETLVTVQEKVSAAVAFEEVADPETLEVVAHPIAAPPFTVYVHEPDPATNGNGDCGLVGVTTAVKVRLFPKKAVAAFVATKVTIGVFLVTVRVPEAVEATLV
jgi:hypothetical protein